MTSLQDLEQEVRLLRGQFAGAVISVDTIITGGDGGGTPNPPPAPAATVLGSVAELPDDLTTTEGVWGCPAAYAQLPLSPTGLPFTWSVIEAPQKGPTGLTSAAYLADWVAATQFTPVFTVHLLGTPTTGVTTVANVASFPSTFVVNDASEWPASGGSFIVATSGTDAHITYASKSGNTFSGCTMVNAGTGSVAASASVTASCKTGALASGPYDAHWTTLATNLLNGGFGDAIIRFGWEFNQNIFYWSQRYATGADFVGYWRRVVNAMRAVVGTSFKFVWCPGLAGSYNNTINFGEWWPGGASDGGTSTNVTGTQGPYVDYVGMDVYDQDTFGGHYTGSPTNPTASERAAVWDNIVNATGNATGHQYGLGWLERFASAHSLPICIGEWGLWSDNNAGGGDDPAFINRMSSWIQSRNVPIALYFQDGAAFLSSTQNPNSWALFKKWWAKGSGPGTTITGLVGSEANAVTTPTSLVGGYSIIGSFLPPTFSLLRDNNDVNAGDWLGKYAFGGFYGSDGASVHDEVASIIGFARTNWDDGEGSAGMLFQGTPGGTIYPQTIGTWTTQGQSIISDYTQADQANIQLGTSLNASVDHLQNASQAAQTTVPYSVLFKYPRARVNLEGKVALKTYDAFSGLPPAYQHTITYANFAMAKVTTSVNDATTFDGTQSLFVDSTRGFPSSGTVIVQVAYESNAPLATFLGNGIRLTYTSLTTDESLDGVTFVHGQGLTWGSGSHQIPAGQGLARSQAFTGNASDPGHPTPHTNIISGQGFLNVPVVYAGSPLSFASASDTDGLANHNFPGYGNNWEIGFYEGPVFSPSGFFNADGSQDLANTGTIDKGQQAAFVSYLFANPGTRFVQRYGFFHNDVSAGSGANGDPGGGSVLSTVASITGGPAVGTITALTLTDASLYGSAGSVTVETSTGIAALSYSGKSGNQLTGISQISGSGNVVVGANVSTYGGICNRQIGFLAANLDGDGSTIHGLTGAIQNFGFRTQIKQGAIYPDQYGLYIGAGGSNPTFTQAGIYNEAQFQQFGPSLMGNLAFLPGSNVDFSNVTGGLDFGEIFLYPNDTTFTARPYFLACVNTNLTLSNTSGGADMGDFLQFAPTLTYTQAPSGFGIAAGLNFAPKFQNDTTLATTLYSAYSVISQGLFTARNQNLVVGSLAGPFKDMWSKPHFATSGGGAFTSGYFDNLTLDLTLDASCTLTRRRGLVINGVAGSGSATSDIAVQINDSSAATTFQINDSGSWFSSNQGAVLGHDFWVGPSFNPGTDAWLWVNAFTNTTYFRGTADFTNSTVVGLTVTGNFGVTGSSLFSGLVGFAAGAQSSSPTASIGYTTGAGGTATPNPQATNKTTGVTLNRPSGRINMNSASLPAGSSVSFVLTNSTIGVNDVVIVNVVGTATAASYLVGIDNVQAGSCRIHLRNTSTGAKSEAVVLQFAVIKASVN